MKISATLTLAIGASSVALPSASTGRFLEPISLHDDTNVATMIPSDERFTSDQRMLQLRQYNAGVLATGTPSYVAIFDEAFQFDVKAQVTTTYSLVYYQRPVDLTAANQTNWLTYRYPQILRTATEAAFGALTKNAAAYDEALKRLYVLIDAANQEAELPVTRGLTSGLNTPGVEGSLLSFIGTTTVPVQAVLIEAQALLYSLLRTREMLAEVSSIIMVGGSSVALPARFLDPIGRMRLTSYNVPVRHKDPGFILQARNYDELSGTLGADPFTTAIGSANVSVALAAHGFSQESVFYTSGSSPVGGVSIMGSFPITAITTNTFTIDISSLGVLPTSTATGGGAAAAYLCDNLVQGIPNWWGIWDEKIHFDVAFSQQSLCELQYYRSLPLLVAPSDSNFLITRYPQLFRAACQVASANMRVDPKGYADASAKLQSLVQAASIDNDGVLRGMELDTMTP